MTKSEFADLLLEIQAAEREVRESGQAEYAHDESNAFRNFDALATDLHISREQVLWIYLKKHLDGILAYINGHRSQREDITGRIKDARMYLALLWPMVTERRDVVDDGGPEAHPTDYNCRCTAIAEAERLTEIHGDPQMTRTIRCPVQRDTFADGVGNCTQLFGHDGPHTFAF